MGSETRIKFERKVTEGKKNVRLIHKLRTEFGCWKWVIHEVGGKIKWVILQKKKSQEGWLTDGYAWLAGPPWISVSACVGVRWGVCLPTVSARLYTYTQIFSCLELSWLYLNIAYLNNTHAPKHMSTCKQIERPITPWQSQHSDSGIILSGD